MTNSMKVRRSRRIAMAMAGSIVALSIPTTASAVLLPQSASACPSGAMCVWTGTSYTGTIWKTTSTSAYIAIGPGTIRSYFNNRSKRTYLHEQRYGGGIFACLRAGAKSASLSGWTIHAEAVYLSAYTLC